MNRRKFFRNCLLLLNPFVFRLNKEELKYYFYQIISNDIFETDIKKKNIPFYSSEGKLLAITKPYNWNHGTISSHIVKNFV